MSSESEKSTDLRSHPNDPETRESIIEDRRGLFRELGFSDDFVGKLEESRETLYTKESIQNKIRGLEQRGFSDPVKMVTSRPQLLSRSFDSIDEKIEGLKQRGFSDPVKMITALPAVLGYTFDNIDQKLEGLKQRGFSDPVKIITSLPQVLGYAFENIDQKLEGLKQRGFSDPVKMITNFPSVLGLAFDNIDRKLSMLKKLIKHYDLKLDAVEVIENFPTFIGRKADKLWAIARIFCETAKDPSEITESKIRELLFKNIENLILAVRSKENMRLNEVLNKARQINKQKLPKSEKRKRIAALPDSDMLKKRYFRGYPKP